jgi:hypothetical protein
MVLKIRCLVRRGKSAIAPPVGSSYPNFFPNLSHHGVKTPMEVFFALAATKPQPTNFKRIKNLGEKKFAHHFLGSTRFPVNILGLTSRHARSPHRCKEL